MAKYRIVMQSYPEQIVRINVPMNGINKPLSLQLRYNRRGKFWSMDVKDSYAGDIYISSIPLVVASDSSVNNLLRQFKHFDIGEIEVKKTVDTPTTDYPDLDNFLKDFVLMWGDGND